MENSPLNQPTEDQPEKGNQILDKAEETFKWWKNLSTLNEQDPTPIIITKILIRIIGIIILVIISPFVILALIVAFTAAL